MQIQNVNSVVLVLFPWPSGPCIRCILIHLCVYITEGCRQTQCPPQVHTGTDILEGKHWISILFAWVFLLYKKIIDICRSIATDYFLCYLALKHWWHTVFSSIKILIQASRGSWGFPYLQKLARATKTKHIISLFNPCQIIKALQINCLLSDIHWDMSLTQKHKTTHIEKNLFGVLCFSMWLTVKIWT